MIQSNELWLWVIRHVQSRRPIAFTFSFLNLNHGIILDRCIFFSHISVYQNKTNWSILISGTSLSISSLSVAFSYSSCFSFRIFLNLSVSLGASWRVLICNSQCLLAARLISITASFVVAPFSISHSPWFLWMLTILWIPSIVLCMITLLESWFALTILREPRLTITWYLKTG